MKKPALVLLASLMLSAPISIADTQKKTPEFQSDNVWVKVFAARTETLLKGMLNRYEELLELSTEADKTQNKRLLRHTKAAITETRARLTEVCVPLLPDLGEALNKEDQRGLKQLEGLSDAFQRQFKAFEVQCTVDILPHMYWDSNQDGSKVLLSDALLERPSIQVQRLNIMMAGNRFAHQALTEAKVATQRASSSAQRLRERALKIDRLIDSCQIKGKALGHFIDLSDDLLEIRRRKARLQRACTPQLTPTGAYVLD